MDWLCVLLRSSEACDSVRAMARARLTVPPRAGEVVGEPLRMPGGVGTLRAACANCPEPAGGVLLSSGVSRKEIELAESLGRRSTLPMVPQSVVSATSARECGGSKEGRLRHAQINGSQRRQDSGQNQILPRI